MHHAKTQDSEPTLTPTQTSILYLMYLKGRDGHAMLCGADANGKYDVYTRYGTDEDDDDTDAAWDRDARYLHQHGYISGNDTHDYYASYTLTPKGAALFAHYEEN